MTPKHCPSVTPSGTGNHRHTGRRPGGAGAYRLPRDPPRPGPSPAHTRTPGDHPSGLAHRPGPSSRRVLSQARGSRSSSPCPTVPALPHGPLPIPPTATPRQRWVGSPAPRGWSLPAPPPAPHAGGLSSPHTPRRYPSAETSAPLSPRPAAVVSPSRPLPPLPWSRPAPYRSPAEAAGAPAPPARPAPTAAPGQGPATVGASWSGRGSPLHRPPARSHPVGEASRTARPAAPHAVPGPPPSWARTRKHGGCPRSIVGAGGAAILGGGGGR